MKPKMLSIFCSDDLEGRVVEVLDRAGIEGFLCLAHATGNKFKPRDELPRLLTWDAKLLLVPGAPDEKVKAILGELEVLAGSCEVAPCLKVIVSDVEKAL